MAVRYDIIFIPSFRKEGNMSDERKGKLIVFEGCDQSGKETQINLLEEKLKDYKKLGPITRISFPDYDGPIGRIIKDHLDGYEKLDAHTLTLLHAADKTRFVEQINFMLMRGEIIIIDRYILSCIIYAAVEYVDPSWADILLANLPLADITFYLDVDEKVRAARKPQFLKDRNEANDELQRKVRDLFLISCQEEDIRLRSEFIDANGDPHDISDKIYSILIERGIIS